MKVRLHTPRHRMINTSHDMSHDVSHDPGVHPKLLEAFSLKPQPPVSNKTYTHRRTQTHTHTHTHTDTHTHTHTHTHRHTHTHTHTLDLLYTCPLIIMQCSWNFKAVYSVSICIYKLFFLTYIFRRNQAALSTTVSW